MANSDVRVVTWNMHGSAHPNISEIATWLQQFNPDIVFVQEIQRKQSIQLAKLLGCPSPHWAFKHWPVVKRREGMAIISRHEMSAQRTLALAKKTNPFSHARRICQLASIKIISGDDTTMVNVGNVHLSAHSNSDRIIQMDKFVNIAKSFGALSLLCGDFNDSRSSGPIGLVANLGLVVANSESTAWTQKAYRDPNAVEPTLCLDRICVSSKVSVINTQSWNLEELRVLKTLSDHAPVFARLKLES